MVNPRFLKIIKVSSWAGGLVGKSTYGHLYAESKDLILVELFLQIYLEFYAIE